MDNYGKNPAELDQARRFAEAGGRGNPDITFDDFAGDTWRCRNCGTHNPVTRGACAHCGKLRSWRPAFITTVMRCVLALPRCQGQGTIPMADHTGWACVRCTGTLWAQGRDSLRGTS